MKILIIQQKMICDVLTSTILCEAIKEKHTDAELHYLINSNTVFVVENNPYIDEVIIYSPEIDSNKFKFWHFIKFVRKEKYDVAIDVYSKLSSNIISLFSKAQTRISYYKKYTCFLYTHAINMAKALKIPTFSIFSPWINKEGWNLFEDGKTHTSIHLKDCKPELYQTETHKKLKNESNLMYSQFIPEYIIPKLTTFLGQ